MDYREAIGDKIAGIKIWYWMNFGLMAAAKEIKETFDRDKYSHPRYGKFFY